MAENVITTNEPIEAVRAQRDALLEQVVELEESLQAKQLENEKLGSRVTNLELDVQRRDKEITRLKGQVDDGALVRALKSDLAFAHNESKRYQTDYTAARKEIVALNIQLQQAVALKADVTADEARAEVVKLRNEKAEVEAKLQSVSSERDRLLRTAARPSLMVDAPEATSAPAPDWMVIAGERDELKAEAHDWKLRCLGAEASVARLDREMANAEDEVKRLRSAGTATFAPLTPTCPLPHAMRQRLPRDRDGKTFKLRIGSEEKLCPECKSPLPGSRSSGHLTLNRYPDGRVGEMFLALDRSRRGDLAGTFAHQFAIVTSIALQYGVPLKVVVDRLRHVRDESGGYPESEKKTPDEENHAVGSMVDLIAMTMERHARELGTWPKDDK